jgi:hypothetical protein
MSNSGQIFDRAEKNKHGWSKNILGGYSEVETIFN